MICAFSVTKCCSLLLISPQLPVLPNNRLMLPVVTATLDPEWPLKQTKQLCSLS